MKQPTNTTPMHRTAQKSVHTAERSRSECEAASLDGRVPQQLCLPRYFENCMDISGCRNFFSVIQVHSPASQCFTADYFEQYLTLCGSRWLYRDYRSPMIRREYKVRAKPGCRIPRRLFQVKLAMYVQSRANSHGCRWIRYPCEGVDSANEPNLTCKVHALSPVV